MSRFLSFAALLSLGSAWCGAQPLGNLGRLSIAAVFSSDAAPEVRNLFDGGPV